MERGYDKKMICKQKLRAQDHSRNDLLETEQPQMPEQKLTFNITYYPAFQNVRGIIEELHILLTPNKEHKKIFPNALVIELRNGKSLKDYLVRDTLLILIENRRCKPCGEKNFIGL